LPVYPGALRQSLNHANGLMKPQVVSTRCWQS
jgi:hypothetical protein